MVIGAANQERKENNKITVKRILRLFHQTNKKTSKYLYLYYLYIRAQIEQLILLLQLNFTSVHKLVDREAQPWTVSYQTPPSSVWAGNSMAMSLWLKQWGAKICTTHGGDQYRLSAGKCQIFLWGLKRIKPSNGGRYSSTPTSLKRRINRSGRCVVGIWTRWFVRLRHQ